MKKLLIALSIAALTTSVYAMSKPPADAGAATADTPCAVKAACTMKDAAECCTTNGTCTMKEAAKCCTVDGTCKVEDAALCADKASCESKKAACSTGTAVEESTGCAGGVCPLKK
jgi:hypothetical protein